MVSASSPSCGQLAYWPGTFEVQRGISAACCGSSPKSIIAVKTCRLICTWLSAPGVPKTYHSAPSFRTNGGVILFLTPRPGRRRVGWAGGGGQKPHRVFSGNQGTTAL